MKIIIRKRRVEQSTFWAEPASHFWHNTHTPIGIGVGPSVCWNGWIEDVPVAFGETSWLGKHHG